MSKLSQLTLPIKDPSTGDISLQTFDIGGGEVDTEFSPTSTNAVQNKVITNVLPDKEEKWESKTWSGFLDSYFSVSNIWTDGDNIYYSDQRYAEPDPIGINYVLDSETSTWSVKTWTGLTAFRGENVWSDGDNIYCYASGGDGGGGGGSHYVLDKSTSTWSAKIWTGLPTSYFYGTGIWTDGTNIYYSENSTQLVLDKSTSTWSTKTWSGLTDFSGREVWSIDDDIYCSWFSTQYVLDKSTSTWSAKIWNGLTEFRGDCVWTVDDNIYYSLSETQYQLDKSTFTWESKTWNGNNNFWGTSIWKVGNDIYCSNQYVLSRGKGFGTAASKDSGAANGVAELDSNGKVPGTQLPTFVGTTAQWNALTSAQQAVYEERILTDDTAETRGIDSTPTENSTNLVTSGGVYAAIAAGGGNPFDFSDLDFVTTGLTYSNAEYLRGGYIKVGSLVFVDISIGITSTPTSAFATHPEISGLPSPKEMFIAAPWVDNYGGHGVTRMSGTYVSWGEHSGIEQGVVATVTFIYIAAD